MIYDEIVVGGGSSGAVVAARLSEDSKKNVLLIEAGPDYQNIETTPETLLDERHLPKDHDWGITAEMVDGRYADYARGKVIGGCSSVNACLALRGTPEDYNEWCAFGNSDWDWDRVLPVFRQMETDELGASEYHGTTGPTYVRRYREDQLTSAQSGFVEACQELGFPTCADNNHPNATGVGSGPWNHQMDGNRTIRGSTAITYLLPARIRANLSIKANCIVDRVLFEGTRAVGVSVKTKTGTVDVFGKRITLSAGAFGSPAILLRSGIGPSEELKALGIQPRLELPGVGRNLIDHAFIGICWETVAGVVNEDTPLIQVLLRYTALGSAQENDMQVIPFQTLPQPALQLNTMLMKPHSRGTLRLQSADPEVQPAISLNLVSDSEDLRRVVEGMRILGKFVQTLQLKTLGSDQIVLWSGETLSSDHFAERLRQEAWTEDHIKGVIDHYVHPVGTARMGKSNDPGSVVDQHGRVHGVFGLRVVDASIMPTIPRANTNLTCIMIGERISEWMRDED